MIEHEHVHDGFGKWHLNARGQQPWPFRPVLHHFNGPEPEHAHCHPWDWKSICVRNWYDALEFKLEHGRLVAVGEYRISEGIVRCYRAETIHRIIRTHADGCWTWAEYGPCRRESRFYRADGVSRAWHESNWPDER